MPVLLVVAALVALVVAGAALYRARHLRRVLDAQRAEQRLTAGMQRNDVAALHKRIQQLTRDLWVLSEAERVVDSALASDRTEGGHP
ncbi:hypothetical protein AB0G67_40745 [Streptomyces sp. NPDC021056]|uniref:hypothetical protein n=1 Tax=Streptomyces sp. NPDC021056 TaxID=3155012 RepID=UPI0033C73308